MIGKVYKFKLDFDFGFGYCNIVDFTTSDSLCTLIVRVYNLSGNDNYTITQIKNAEYLLQPIRIYNRPNTRGKGAWKFVGDIYSEELKEIPKFKHLSRLGRIFIDESKNSNWRVEEKFWVLSDDIFSYSQIGHLEQQYLLYKDTIIRRTTMELIKLRGQDINAYFDINLPENKWDYIRSINLPFYSDIPFQYRNSIIPIDELPSKGQVPFRSEMANPKIHLEGKII